MVNAINYIHPRLLPAPTVKPTVDSPKHILIAEPDDSNYLYLSIVTKKLGFVVRRASTGIEAIEAVMCGEPIALILMNTHLPVIDGYDATSRIVAVQKSIPIISLISSSFPEFSYRAVNAGCSDFVIMPVQPDVLEAKIKMWYKE